MSPQKTDNLNPCPFCASSDSRVLYPVEDLFGDHYQLNSCNGCKAFFLAPPPSEKQLAQAYDSSYYGEKEEKFSASGVEKVLDYFRAGRARSIARLLKPGAKILDVGCGNGRFLGFLSTYGNFQLYGAELDGNSARRAARVRDINLKVGSLETGDFPNNYFDAVTLFHVFEHLKNPSEILDIITSISKPGGVVVFSFPNIVSFQARMFKGKWLHLDPPRHLFYFAPRDFEKVMNSRGFTLMRSHYSSAEQNPFGMIQSILNLVVKKREVLFESMKGNDEYVKDYRGMKLLSQKMFFLFHMPLFILTDIVGSFFGKSATIEMTFSKGARN
jgi:2-polyprenyl-3-methyl-5-hydroxy-6-metoxy-1,4-benzoquinol methylase